MRWVVLTSILSLAIVVVVMFLGAASFRGAERIRSFISPAETRLRQLVSHRDVGEHNSDVRVWVNLRSGLYYCPKTRFYGEIKPGSYMVQREAIQHGYRPALGQACGP